MPKKRDKCENQLMLVSEESKFDYQTFSNLLSTAGPPLLLLYLIPKSPFGPPGLCEAVRMIPPDAFISLITDDTVGVDRIPF